MKRFEANPDYDVGYHLPGWRPSRRSHGAMRSLTLPASVPVSRAVQAPNGNTRARSNQRAGRACRRSGTTMTTDESFVAPECPRFRRPCQKQTIRSRPTAAGPQCASIQPFSRSIANPVSCPTPWPNRRIIRKIATVDCDDGATGIIRCSMSRMRLYRVNSASLFQVPERFQLRRLFGARLLFY